MLKRVFPNLRSDKNKASAIDAQRILKEPEREDAIKGAIQIGEAPKLHGSGHFG
jgi:hypothetical protein